MANRKDPRGRTLKSGEVYRKDGRYVYTDVYKRQSLHTVSFN